MPKLSGSLQDCLVFVDLIRNLLAQRQCFQGETFSLVCVNCADTLLYSWVKPMKLSNSSDPAPPYSPPHRARKFNIGDISAHSVYSADSTVYHETEKGDQSSIHFSPTSPVTPRTMEEGVMIHVEVASDLGSLPPTPSSTGSSTSYDTEIVQPPTVRYRDSYETSRPSQSWLSLTTITTNRTSIASDPRISQAFVSDSDGISYISSSCPRAI
jgi:hypothetical protein